MPQVFFVFVENRVVSTDLVETLSEAYREAAIVQASSVEGALEPIKNGPAPMAVFVCQRLLVAGGSDFSERLDALGCAIGVVNEENRKAKFLSAAWTRLPVPFSTRDVLRIVPLRNLSGAGT